MKYIKYYAIPLLIILSCFAGINRVFAEQLITFFLRPYPTADAEVASKKLGQKLGRPGKLAGHQAKQIVPAKVSGIFATYGGFLTTSDLNGQISFPRKHEAPAVNILITEKISPMIMSGNTIHHWELVEGSTPEYYRIEQKTDPETQATFWDTYPLALPSDNIIPLETIIIFANPKYTETPIGISPVTKSPNLILPDLYIKNGLNIALNSLYVVNLSHYFGPIFFMYQKEPHRYSSHLTY